MSPPICGFKSHPRRRFLLQYFEKIFISKQPIICMDKEENPVVIKKVDAETFDDFLGLQSPTFGVVFVSFGKRRFLDCP